MNQNQNTTFTSNFQDETLYINYCINNILMQINTTLPAKIVSIDGLRATVQPIILPKGLNQASPTPIQIANVPLCQLIGGNAGIIIDYQVNDVVLLGVIQRDISSIKNTWSQAVPPSNRKFNLADAVVLFKLSNTLPTTYVKITDDGGIEIKCSGTQPVSITTNGDVTASCNKATITATNDVLITSSTQIKLSAPEIILDGDVQATSTLEVESIQATSIATDTLTIGGSNFTLHKHTGGTLPDGNTGGVV